MARPKKNIIPEKEKEKARGRWQTPRGFKDVLPEIYRFWHFLVERLEEIAADYSYQQINTPILENISYWEKAWQLPKEKLQHNFFILPEHDGHPLILRPDLLIPLTRTYFEHNMSSWTQPVKLWQCGPVFRREENEFGHQRQFYQFVFSLFNSDSPEADAQIIMMAQNIYRALGLTTEVEINSIGCHKCRREYGRVLAKFLKDKKICLSCRKKIDDDPMVIFACLDKKCQEAITTAPPVVDSLCPECREHFVRVLEVLDENSVIYNLSPLLIPAQPYWQRTVCEFYFACPGDKKSNFLGAGGRLDALTQMIGNHPLGAVAFFSCTEKIILKLKDQGIEVKEESHGDVFIAQLGEEAKKKCLKLFNELRKEGVKVKEAFAKKGLADQLEVANRLKVKYALILGQKEILDGTIIIRDMESGVQEIIDFEKVIAETKKRLLGLSDVKIYSDNNHTANS